MFVLRPVANPRPPAGRQTAPDRLFTGPDGVYVSAKSQGRTLTDTAAGHTANFTLTSDFPSCPPLLSSAHDQKKLTLPKKKVLIPIGDATEVMDTLYPIYRLPEDGFEAVVCGPEARLYHGVLHEIPPTAEGEPKWDITRESTPITSAPPWPFAT